MADTVFYSWQSDAPDRETGSLIRDALQAAIADVSSELGLGDSLTFDQDTQGVPGNPEVASTILQKIGDCGIFVADMSLVASTPSGKKSPNPNVLLEYGFALGVKGKSRLVTVMNSFYGEPKELPFDLANRRWPFSYLLPPDAPAPELRDAREALRKRLVVAIRTIVEAESLGARSQQDPQWWTPAVDGEASFLRDGDLVDVDRGSFDDEPPIKVVWKNRPQAFLRILPFRSLTLSRGELDAAIRPIPPMSRGGMDVRFGRNPQGATSYTKAPESRDEPLVEMLTQLFPTGEMWGIHQSFYQRPFIAMGTTQDIFRFTLSEYLAAAKRLSLALPYTVIAGISGIMGREVVTSERRRVGYCMDNELVLRIQIADPNVDPDRTLAPFYGMIWESAGVRPGDR